MGVSDRRLQVFLTQEAKNPTSFLLFVGFFAFAGFINGLRRFPRMGNRLFASAKPKSFYSSACRCAASRSV